MTVNHITGRKIGDTIDDPDDDRFQAVPTVDLIDFVNARFDRFGTDEYIRVFADQQMRQLRLYRKVSGDPGEGEFVRAILDGVSIQLDRTVNGEPEAYNLHNREAQTLVTWLGMLAKERADIAAIRFEYYGETGKPAMQDTGAGEESISLSYRTETGRYFQTEITDAYTVRSNMMARHPK